MDKSNAIIIKYGITPDLNSRNEIINLLKNEINNQSDSDNEYLKTLCILIFSFGKPEDSTIIWKAKMKNFDTGCYIDIQLLCGAGLYMTKQYLKSNHYTEILEYIIECEKAGDFINFSKQKLIANYKAYYRI